MSSPQHLSSAKSRLKALKASKAKKARIHNARRRGKLRIGALVVLAIATVVVVLTVDSGGSPRESYTPTKLRHDAASDAVPSEQATLTSSWSVAGRPAALPFPSRGEAAVEVSGLGLVGATARQRCVPMASVTKIMTAYIILKDHPLLGDSGGPEFTMTSSDHEAWIEAVESDESNLEVVTGEHLDERQLLQALMIPSADNIADYLARWDAGSIPAFVDKMNAEASTLGLGCTHYADASGVNPLSRSSSVYQAKLAGLAMQDSALRSITDEMGVRFPVAGEFWNIYNPAIGVDGIIGVKSGFTDAAQVCLITAAWRALDGHRVLVISAVLGQPSSLYAAAQDDEALLDAVTKELRVVTLLPAEAEIGTATVGWEKTRVAIRLGPEPLTVVAWPGLSFKPLMVPLRLRPPGSTGWAAGSMAATLDVQDSLGTCLQRQAMLTDAIPPPPTGWTASAGLSG